MLATDVQRLKIRKGIDKMRRYFDFDEELFATKYTRLVIAKQPLLEDKDYSVAWKKGSKASYCGFNDEKQLHIVKSRLNHHKYYFTDAEFNDWFEFAPDTETENKAEA